MTTVPVAEQLGAECDYYSEGEPHDEFCPHAPFVITRGGVVDSSVASAQIAIDAFVFLRSVGSSEHDAREMAIEDAREAASCFAGVGSCGRGWCKHS